MAATNYDVIIAGVKARILQEGEGSTGYKRRTIRQEIQQQVLSQGDVAALVSRQDQARLYQTSWASGARWWKPLISQADVSSYFQANHLNTYAEPGKVVPGNVHTDKANTVIHDNCVMASDGVDVFAIGDTNTTAAAQRDVYKWDAATETFVRQTGYSSGIQDDSIPVSMAYDPSDGYFYVLAETAAGGREIGRFNPVTPAANLSWFANASPLRYGAAILVSQYGLFYSGGGALFEIDKTGPTQTNRFDPGFEETLDLPAGTEVVNTAPLLCNTPQGMYMVRNQIQGGIPAAFVFRVDRDASGLFIGNPIATLPQGSLALGMQFHLGQLLVASTPDWKDYDDGTENLEIIIYFIGEGGMGALGSPLGGRGEQDETPYMFLGAEGEKIYLGGQKRLWVYDAIRGGLHTAWNWETAQTAGGYRAMARVQDSDGDEILLFLAKDRLNFTKVGDVDDPDTVVAFGDDETYYTLESNVFDGGVPMELKEITEVSILTDKPTVNQEWTVQISPDDGAFADALVASDTSVFSSASLSGVTGFQFRYKLIYQTKNAVRNALRAVLITMTTGKMITEWDLMLDGSQLRNLDNQPQNADDFYDSMVTLGDTATVTTIIDNYQDHQRTEDSSGAGTKVKVSAVEIVKDVPGESVIRVLLRAV